MGDYTEFFSNQSLTQRLHSVSGKFQHDAAEGQGHFVQGG